MLYGNSLIVFSIGGSKDTAVASFHKVPSICNACDYQFVGIFYHIPWLFYPSIVIKNNYKSNNEGNKDALADYAYLTQGHCIIHYYTIIIQY